MSLGIVAGMLNPNYVSRVNAFECTGWECKFNTDRFGNTSQTCYGTPAGCDGARKVCNALDDTCYKTLTCLAGQYICNRVCCDIGTGAPAASSFMAGTIVSTPDGGRKIEDLEVGDRVVSFGNDEIMESVVSKTYKVRRDYYFDLVAGNYSVKVTAKHPFYIGNNEFKTVEELQAGDSVYVIEKNSLVKKKVTSKTKVNQIVDVYNLTVDGTNTYFAGGFAVHNISGPGTGLASELETYQEYVCIEGQVEGTTFFTEHAIRVSIRPSKIIQGCSNPQTTRFA